MNNAPSWGRLKRKRRATLPFEPDVRPASPQSILPYGNGRSYGDSCHNDAGTLVTMGHRNFVLAFDPETGLLTAGGGILIRDILKYIQRSGWFLPVVPGTKFVTLGGAIANDIHGKNHEKRGTFGRYVQNLVLWRSDGEQFTCSNEENQNLFATTIGGMGLTGVILYAQIQLMKVPSHFVEERNTPFANLEAYFDQEDDWEDEHEYSVAWIDSVSKGRAFGRGISITGNHVDHAKMADYGDPSLNVPLTPPIPLVSGLPLRLFNAAYFRRKRQDVGPHLSGPDSFFFPLDAVANWNRLYGQKGLFQHQCVIPLPAAREVIPELLKTSHDFGQGSFLTVLKRFGVQCSPGFMSFPQPGYTLTLDFANRGAATQQLLNRLDDITLDAGGRTNPYKDGRMSSRTFQRAFPEWQRLEALRDPSIQSDFWRRVSQPVTDRSFTAPPSLSTPVNHAAQQGVQNPILQSTRDKAPARAATTGTR